MIDLYLVNKSYFSGFGKSPAIFIYAALIFFSIVGAVCSFIIPWWAFLSLTALAIVLFLGLIKPEITFVITILVMIEELCQMFFIFPIAHGHTYTVRFFFYTIPLIATFLGLCVKTAKSDLSIQRTPLDSLLLFIICYQFISISWVPGHTMSALIFVNLLMNLLFYLVTTNILTDIPILKKTITFIIIAGLINASGTIASIFIDAVYEVWLTDAVGFIFEFTAFNNRPGGFGGANHSASFTNLALFCALGRLVSSQGKRQKIFLTTAILVMASGVILTQSRGAYIGLAGALAAYILINIKVFKKPLFATCSAMAILFCLTMVVQPSFLERIMIGFGYQGSLYLSPKDKFSANVESGGSGGHKVSISGMSARKEWWMSTLNEMLRKPAKLLFGLGCGGYLYYAGGCPEINSIYFAFVYDMGILGLILLMVIATLLISNLYTCLTLPENSFAQQTLFSFTGAMVSIIVIHGLIEYDLTAFGSKLIWFPVALSMAVVNLIKGQQQFKESMI